MFFTYIFCISQTTDLHYDCIAIIVDTNNSGTHTRCSTDFITLKITQGLTEAQTIAWNSSLNDSIFYALNIPKELWYLGSEIIMDIRTPKKDELPRCMNYEMPVRLGRPIIYVVRTEIINAP